jgi:hypothetical protein
MSESNKVGRPLKFKTVEELQEKIDAYFALCNNHEIEVLTKLGTKVKVKSPLPRTITGLALSLDTTRETLLDYENKDEFSDTIIRAKLQCQHDVELGSLTGNLSAPASIFNLKNNYGWHDKTEQEVDSTITVKVTNFGEEEHGDSPSA